MAVDFNASFNPLTNILERMTTGTQEAREARIDRQAEFAKRLQQQRAQMAQNAANGAVTSTLAKLGIGQAAAPGYIPPGGSGNVAGSKVVTNKFGHKIPLTTVTTPGGAKTTVNSNYANQFLGLLTELERAGYKLSTALGYQDRVVAGTKTPSKHAGGYAIDINPGKNPYTTNIGQTEFNPTVVNNILKKYPMFEWGGNWKGARKDYMHFSVKERISGYSGL